MAIGRVPGQTGIQPSIVTAKGDLIVATASGSVTNQAVGSNNQVLTADSAQADGVKWANGSAATLTTTGDIIYASAANTPARLGIGSTGQVLTVSGGIPSWATASSSTPSFVGCFMYKSSNQSISNDTSTVLTFTAEEIDTDGFHDNSTNTGRITIPSGKGGKYLFIGYASFETNGTGSRAVSFVKNGSTTVASPTRIAALGESGSDTRVNGQIIVNLVAGDYIEMTAYQKSGGSLNVQGDSIDTFRTKFGCVYLGA
jgi:hypothetical protein